MRLSSASLVVVGIAAFGTIFVAQGTGARDQPAAIAIDYPMDGSVFPPDIGAPTFLWRDPDPGAALWRIDVSFGEGGPRMELISSGEKYSA
jgi:hypothetical protein